MTFLYDRSKIRVRYSKFATGFSVSHKNVFQTFYIDYSIIMNVIKI